MSAATLIDADGALVDDALPIRGAAGRLDPCGQCQTLLTAQERIVSDLKPAFPVENERFERERGGGGLDLHVADDGGRQSWQDTIGNGIGRTVRGVHRAITQSFAAGGMAGLAKAAISSSANARPYTSGWAISPMNAALPLLAAPMCTGSVVGEMPLTSGNTNGTATLAGGGGTSRRDGQMGLDGLTGL